MRARMCRSLVFSDLEFSDLEFQLSGSWPFKLLDRPLSMQFLGSQLDFSLVPV